MKSNQHEYILKAILNSSIPAVIRRSSPELMVIDSVTGVLYAFISNQLNSEVGFKGLVKKLMILVVLIIGVMLDRILGTGNWVFRTLVCYFYIANEGISLLENVANIGIPIPNKIRNALEQLNKDDKESE